MKILITGAAGKLGSALVTALQDSHDVSGTTLLEDTYPRLDITNFDAVCDHTRQIEPDLVINAAAWTDVDGCARNPEKALTINATGAQNLAIAAAQVNAAIVQISSNEVFNGKLDRLYYEYDDRQPVNPYGYSKYAGEKAVAAVNPRHYIIRTAWLFAPDGHNFIHAILGAARAGKSLRIVTNEIANPTYSLDLAAAIASLIDTGRYGTYHLVNEGAVSRYNFGCYALERAGYGTVPVERISLGEWSRPSTPPVYTGMANLMAASLGIRLRPWQDAVDAFLAQAGLLRDQPVPESSD